jgi:hypothetical protein
MPVGHLLLFELTFELLNAEWQYTNREQQTRYALSTIKHIGSNLFNQKKAAAISSSDMQGDELKSNRDLLSLLVRANMATDIPEAQRLNDQDVIARELFR